MGNGHKLMKTFGTNNALVAPAKISEKLGIMSFEIDPSVLRSYFSRSS
jgi:hypothetical protein